MTEKEEPTLLSTEKANRLCKCWDKKGSPTIKVHTKQIFSDGWTRWVCFNCGKVSFTIGDK